MFRPGRGNATPTEPENIDGDRVLANASATTNGAHLLRRTCGPGLPLAATWGSEAESWVCLVFVSQGWGSVHSIPCNLWLNLLIRVIRDILASFPPPRMTQNQRRINPTARTPPGCFAPSHESPHRSAICPVMPIAFSYDPYTARGSHKVSSGTYVMIPSTISSRIRNGRMPRITSPTGAVEIVAST
jgi:hypothetical protein